ncbi:MAG: spore photoproduct lyase [Clostridia bacterium]|nr:spore photoproduct lyase [Clostridia bacterium]
MFIPNQILYEKEIENYVLGKELLNKFKDVPKTIIENHNNIPMMREKSNAEFPKMKQSLIIATRKTHKYVENHKVSDYLVPYTSSGCTAMCLYCYLVCNYNKCAYLRLFVNREEMLNKIIKTANQSEKELTFEIGSNSDLILENTITENLPWTIETFAKNNKGYLTFPTKFDMVEPLLHLNHNGRTIIRMSVNPEEIIRKIEFGTSPLDKRIAAINQLADSNYPIGILIAPVILVNHWENLYEDLIAKLSQTLSEKARSQVFFEVILMTYSYIHRVINQEAFPNAIDLYNKDLMTGRGKGKYAYKQEVRNIAEEKMREMLQKHFPKNKIVYFS